MPDTDKQMPAHPGDPNLDRLFVYGSLRQQSCHPMARFLRDRACLIGLATVRGILFEVSWYPGAIHIENASSRIQGEVYQIAHPTPTLAILDEYEGCIALPPSVPEYERIVVPAILSNNHPASVWFYQYLGNTENLKIISTGYFPDSSAF
jgi:gamma-glutamylcyclotransferase (GGCT)/AIG2-like uncharacterized protein YtfP